MIWTNVIVWVCGKAVFVRRLLTWTEWARLPHLTGAMIKLKAAKLSAGGALILCSGGVAWWTPQIVGGGSFFTPTAFVQERPVNSADVAEPGTAAILVTAVAGLALIRRK